jgi:dTDP-glucose 4,6-dehydratase
MKKVIVYVTGCAGFIGYHVAQECLNKGWYVIGVDKMTYASNDLLLQDLERYVNFKFIKSDINDLDHILECDYIINTAAETHVDNSISNSDVFVKSNINGVHHLLQLIKQKYRFKMPTLLHFSTDEVYGDTKSGSFKESSILNPSNPYAATKAAADMLILAWSRTYDVPYVIVRPSNNYGIGQYVEKLIPHSIKNLSLGKKIPLHDKGLPVRNWLHAKDTARAITTIIESEVKNEIFNISGNVEMKNYDVVKQIIKYMDIKGVEEHLDLTVTRPGQDIRYSIDDSKLKKYGWKPEAKFQDELKMIVKWYTKNFVW